ncbi:hypothetical protein RR48_05199 [Papilio machaon]|uniref:FLYWCH-type domain-containing protein n=1 Tax=Papilio machaon TaxID=76193 RepID=A0A0N1IP21_PAPMA|nr:hypothetical protein RR48_05199 [Papilio machaon]
MAGYTYYYVTTVGPKTRWRCSTHSSRGCSAHLYTINDTLFSTKGSHTHPPRDSILF